MKKDNDGIKVKKEKTIQASFWNSKLNEADSNRISEYKQITKNMPFTLKIVK